nr:DUF4235 domain-containing protein [Barrientosiimonas endolithica]
MEGAGDRLRSRRRASGEGSERRHLEGRHRRQAPANPADPDVSWKEAAVFAIVSGAIMGVARMVAQKQAAHFYTKSAGHPPEALKADLQGKAKAK